MLTYIEMPGQTELKQCDYMIEGDHEAVSLKHRPWNITASTPNAIANYLCWAQLSLRFWHFWWVSSLFQWLPTISKSVLSLIVGRLYIRISLTTRENALVARDGEGFMWVAMLLHVLMFLGLLARPAGRSDWPSENYPVRTSRVMRKAGAARRRLAEKLLNTWLQCIGQRQLQDGTRNVYVWRLGVSYIRKLTVCEMHMVSRTKHQFCAFLFLLQSGTETVYQGGSCIIVHESAKTV